MDFLSEKNKMRPKKPIPRIDSKKYPMSARFISSINSPYRVPGDPIPFYKDLYNKFGGDKNNTPFKTPQELLDVLIPRDPNVSKMPVRHWIGVDEMLLLEKEIQSMPEKILIYLYLNIKNALLGAMKFYEKVQQGQYN